MESNEAACQPPLLHTRTTKNVLMFSSQDTMGAHVEILLSYSIPVCTFFPNYSITGSEPSTFSHHWLLLQCFNHSRTLSKASFHPSEKTVPSSLVSSNLLGMHFTPVSRSLIKMLNRTSHTNGNSTCDWTSNRCSLIPCNHLSTTVKPLHCPAKCEDVYLRGGQIFQKGSMRDGTKGLTKF